LDILRATSGALALSSCEVLDFDMQLWYSMFNISTFTVATQY